MSLRKFSYALWQTISICPRFSVYLCQDSIKTHITSIETRNVRCFTFVSSVKGMISVILILVVEVYQQILLSNTEQGFIEGRTIRKVMGGEGTKKNHARENAKKKNSCKEEGKEKNSCRRKVQLWLFQKVWVSFRKSEFQKSTILPGTMWINKNHFLLVERRQLEPCFWLQLVYLQHTLYTVYIYIQHILYLNTIWFKARRLWGRVKMITNG